MKKYVKTGGFTPEEFNQIKGISFDEIAFYHEGIRCGIEIGRDGLLYEVVEYGGFNTRPARFLLKVVTESRYTNSAF